MSDRILVMNAGRVEQDGTPGELYQRPKSRFVADFIGETNFLDCTVKGSENGWLVLDWNGLAVRSGGAARPAGASVEAALRPESVVCAPARPDLPNAFEARIVRQVFKGSRASLHLELAGGSTLEADADPYLLERLAGDRLWVGWQPDRVAILAQ
jgi:spermidine/putrescine transport system ATP-binding protein